MGFKYNVMLRLKFRVEIASSSCLVFAMTSFRGVPIAPESFRDGTTKLDGYGLLAKSKTLPAEN